MSLFFQNIYSIQKICKSFKCQYQVVNYKESSLLIYIVLKLIIFKNNAFT